MASTTHDRKRGLRIRGLREQRGWSQRELAERVGVAKRSIENYEAGAPMRPKTRAALAAALEVNSHWLYTGQSTDERVDDIDRRLGELEHLLNNGAAKRLLRKTRPV